MFALLPYLCMAFMLAVVVAPIVVGLRNRPKRQPRPVTAEPQIGEDGMPEEQEVLDFGDELAENQKQ